MPNAQSAEKKLMRTLQRQKLRGSAKNFEGKRASIACARPFWCVKLLYRPCLLLGSATSTGGERGHCEGVMSVRGCYEKLAIGHLVSTTFSSKWLLCRVPTTTSHRLRVQHFNVYSTSHRPHGPTQTSHTISIGCNHLQGYLKTS